MSSIAEINKGIQPLKDALISHPLYRKIKSIDHLQLFMQTHVYAVWDFMSLLKALQAQLTCTSSPWFASPNPQVRYLINEIVLAEESDVTMTGERLSHFEMYVGAMQASHTDTRTLERFLDAVRTTDIFTAIAESDFHDSIKEFLAFTFEVIQRGKSHEIASAFTFGREDLIPSMFTGILQELRASFPSVDLSQLIYYFERHIELDADEHGPMAFEMIQYLCGDDTQKWEEVRAVAEVSLQKRIKLWDAIEAMIAEQVCIEGE